ncbi:DUF1599 domain-containing protein [Patescibacteria group bacterium]|nr:DUF1599 domain-containing protein [Patescibacteria group bacterium]
MTRKKGSYTLKFADKELPKPEDPPMTKRYQAILREALGLFIEKNNAYKSVFVEYGVVGIFVRIRDKLARLFSDDETIADESIVEDFLDIANYALMGAMISHFHLRRGIQCNHLYAVVDEKAGKKKLRCINCDEELHV